MNKKGVLLVTMAMIAVLCMVGIQLGNMDYRSVGAEVSEEFAILTESGFYQSRVRVEIATPRGARVYYTTNCEEPTPENGQLYQTPIEWAAPEVGEEIHVLRCKAYLADGTESETLTGTYFVGHGIQNRYTTKVLSIVGEPEELFGYDNGILVPGRRYDEFMETNPEIHPGGGVEANYTMQGDEAEREVYIEIFDADGTHQIAQKGGVRVIGHASRLNNHKSLRLYARKEYSEEDNKFRYDFFENLLNESDGTMGQEYKRLHLKNSGQDYGYAFLRNELVGRLSDEAGFPDVQHATPVCVYVNGEYYGSYWLSNHFDGQYFENRYGEYDGEFVVLEYSDEEKTVEEESSEIEAAYTEEYNALYKKYAAMDLTDDKNFEELQQFMDVENYLQYFAIENFVGNFDWPNNNVRTYRYVAGDKGYTEDSVFDGRYRCILYDVDYGFGLMFYYDTIGTLVSDLTLDKIMNEASPMFAALMQREDCRQIFVTYTLDLINGAMSAENVAERVDEMHGERVQELVRTLEVEGLVGGLLLSPDAMNMETVDRNLVHIRSYAEKRPQYVFRDFEEKFGYQEKYQLTVRVELDAPTENTSENETSENETSGIPGAYSRVRVNSVYCEDSTFLGTYLKEVPVTLTPCVGPNETFSHWLVDGQVYEEEQLVLSKENVAGECAEVVLVCCEADAPKLQIAAVAAKGHNDYVELINCSSRSVSTFGYSLTDSAKDPWKYILPTVVLKPGETLRMVGKNNSNPDSLGQYGLNFNLKQGEILQLYYNKQPLDCVEIPALSEDGVYTRDFARGKYFETKR